MRCVQNRRNYRKDLKDETKLMMIERYVSRDIAVLSKSQED